MVCVVCSKCGMVLQRVSKRAKKKHELTLNCMSQACCEYFCVQRTCLTCRWKWIYSRRTNAKKWRKKNAAEQRPINWNKKRQGTTTMTTWRRRRKYNIIIWKVYIEKAITSNSIIWSSTLKNCWWHFIAKQPKTGNKFSAKNTHTHQHTYMHGGIALDMSIERTMS